MIFLLACKQAIAYNHVMEQGNNKERVILHCDCNSYFASVETIARPELKNVPMAVCGDPKSRHGIILAKNELAKKYGIVTAETVWQALKKCPSLTLVAPHHDKYTQYCKIINKIYEEYTDQVEPFSIDESWLDVTGSGHLFGSGGNIADTLRRRIRDEVGLTISVGVSFNKMFAKLGSDYKKPDATTIITRENFREILWPLPAGDMMFVGKNSCAALNRAYIFTIGDIALAGRERICALLGKSGESIWAAASGLDDSPVKRADDISPAKSVGSGLTFARNLITREDISSGIAMLSDNVGTRLRRYGQYCGVVTVHIKDPSLKTISRQRRLDAPTNSTKEIFNMAMTIIEASWHIGAPIRALTVTGGSLCFDAAMQLSMDNSFESKQKNMRLDCAIDSIRQKYGRSAITIAGTMKTDITGGSSDAE